MTLEPEEIDPTQRELERILDEIDAGTISDVDELPEADLDLLIRHRGSLEEVEALFDQLRGPDEL